MDPKSICFLLFLLSLLNDVKITCAQIKTKTCGKTEPTGVWEGEILDEKRPIVTRVDFDNKNVNFDTSGEGLWALSVSSKAVGQIEFSTKAGQFAFKFQAKYSGDELNGIVEHSGRSVPFSLQQLRKTATPINRTQAWQQDLDQLLLRFIKYDKSFSASTRETFRRELQRLSKNIENLSDQEVQVEIAKALALGGNAHTRLYLMRNRTEVRRIPIRVWWFKNRLYIIRTDSLHRSALGCEIKKIGMSTVQSAYSKVKDIDAGSPTWKRYMSSYFLTSPDILFGVGILSKSHEVPITISCNGKEKVIVIPARPLKKSRKPDEAWRHLSPLYNEKNLISAYTGLTVPLYLRHPNYNYWFEYLTESKTLYIQYNRAQQSSEVNSIKRFKDSIAQVLKKRNSQSIIFDLRFNTGGNGYLAEPLIRTIAEQRPKIPVFVITSRATFSAGIMAAAQLRQWANATIVGEAPGDGIDYWAEGGNLILPNSGLAAHYANGFHHYSKKSYLGVQPFVKLSVDSILPSLLAENTWNEYISGRDVAVESILKLLNTEY